MTQDRLAKIVGITQGALSRVITGDRRPRWEIAKIIAYHTGTLVELWMEGDEVAKRAAVKSAGKEIAA